MTHPILTAAATMGEVLKTVADTNPTFMTTSDKADALRELVRVESRLVELRLRMLADADDVAALTASRDAAGWLANETRVRWEDARSDVVLARGLDRRWTVLATAMREGRTTLAQARVISRALDELPSDASAEVVDRAEATLVDYAERFEPRQLARLGRKILDVVAPEIAEEAEARRLAALEEEASRRTRLTMRRLGDGTTRLSGRLPDAAATRLATYLEAFTSPRQLRDDEADSSAADSDPFTRLPYPRRLGEAFIQFLESLDPRRLPLHGGDATTVVVTVPLAALRRELGAADLLGGSVPGEEGFGETITAAQARRLACTAKIIPAVLGGASEVLDMGRARRLFSAAQRRALLLRDRTCRADGCDIPGTWTEAHHWLPWTSGGATDLDNAVLLCSHHHQRVHDPAFTTERMANGDVRFARRR